MIHTRSNSEEEEDAKSLSDETFSLTGKQASKDECRMMCVEKEFEDDQEEQRVALVNR
jgi:hypothetical protein